MQPLIPLAATSSDSKLFKTEGSWYVGVKTALLPSAWLLGKLALLLGWMAYGKLRAILSVLQANWDT